MYEFKKQRMQQIILEELNSMLYANIIKDPRLSPQVTVVQITANKGLTLFTVFVSGLIDFSVIEKSVDILNKAKGYIQHLLGKKYTWKHTPKLNFRACNSLNEGDKVLKKIRDMEDHETTTTH